MPPYSADDETTWSPGSSSVNNAAACAAIPLANATAADPALEVRNPLLEDRDGRVHDPRVGVAVLLQVEVRPCRLGILEDVARRLEDRHRPRARVRVWPLSGVELARLEPELAGLLGEPRSSAMEALQEPADDRRLTRLFEQEAVVPVRRVDHVKLDRLADRAKRLLDLLRPRRRVEPVGAEGDQQRARLDPSSARSSEPSPYWRARSKYVSARDV